MRADNLPLSDLARAAAAEPNARIVAIFGSFARGQERGTSDVDVAVAGCGFWEGLRLGAALGRVLGREPHVVDLDKASDLLRFEVARDGVLVQESERDAWSRFRAEAAVRYWDFAPTLALCAEGARRRLLREARRG